MACEITVTLKNHEKKLTKKSFEVRQITADLDDPIINDRIVEAKKEFNDNVEKMQVTIKIKDE